VQGRKGSGKSWLLRRLAAAMSVAYPRLIVVYHDFSTKRRDDTYWTVSAVLAHALNVSGEHVNDGEFPIEALSRSNRVHLSLTHSGIGSAARCVCVCVSVVLPSHC